MAQIDGGVMAYSLYNSYGRINAMTLRYWYLLRGSWPRMLELIYWPTMNMIVWGFINYYLSTDTYSTYVVAGSLIAAVMLWDVLFRGQLGFTFSFLEEVWSRNVANIMMSPLHPAGICYFTYVHEFNSPHFRDAARFNICNDIVRF